MTRFDDDELKLFMYIGKIFENNQEFKDDISKNKITIKQLNKMMNKWRTIKDSSVKNLKEPKLFEYITSDFF
jgi:hypothetical protein